MQVIVLLLLSIAVAPAASWVNNFHEAFTYTCQTGQSINFIMSAHNDKYKDRIWNFACQNTFSKPASCYWTGYENDFDKPFTFICPFGSVVTGMGSYYDMRTEDRRWQYYCCEGEVEVTRNCKWSDYVNVVQKPFRWDTPVNYYLTGVYSSHDSAVEDRLWKYYYCQKN
ncbi:hemagglutinin/amebocyte aggregation factor-like [Mixophyes fleayi]|uniref:hemagglutinin/amebocyte aggregation factor-like n=1 Tax=Mixophyes fleayi TaxID=3061075 RepID=UPI003F4DE19E